jgi:hypothetical protein
MQCVCMSCQSRLAHHVRAPPGEPLMREHGAPIRAIVPGYLGVRSPKWVSEIVTADAPIETEWQTGFSYRYFPPHLTEAPDDLSPYPAVEVCERASERGNDSLLGWGLSLSDFCLLTACMHAGGSTPPACSVHFLPGCNLRSCQSSVPVC